MASYTHAKAVHHAGPVCGADDGPVTRVTDDPHLVTCPDVPGPGVDRGAPGRRERR